MKKTENKVTQAFAELMIEKIKQFQGDWKKPWVSPGFTGMPQNINGRHYNGINSLMLMLLREEKGYRTPIFMTFHQAKTAGWEVKKGETGFPVELWRQVYKDENGKKLTFEEFNNLSEDEQKRCTSYPTGMTYIVFNVEQTRMPELAPEKFQKLVDSYAPGAKLTDAEGMMRSPELDFMLKNNTWVCPIEQVEGDQAYYSISKDNIVVPLKAQFQDGELFYSTLLHEMAHSTGAKERLDRLAPSSGFGSSEYAREELVAEMTAAMTASQLGITKQVKEDSVAYLKSWLKSLQEEPEFIRTIMSDVNKACNMIQSNVMSDEVAESIKKEAIESIDKFLENKKVEEQLHKAPLLDQEKFEQLTPALNANNKEKLSLPEVPQEFLDLNDKVKQKIKDCTTWVIKDNTVHLIGEDAQRVAKALKLNTAQGVNPQGETIDTLSFKREKLESYLPQVVRRGIRISIQEVKPPVEKQTIQQPQTSSLHMAHLGNGITLWEDGDNEYTAHISPDRKVSLYKDFSPENLQRIQQMAEKGNMLVGNKDAERLALKPLNPAERFIYQPYGADPIPLSQEQIGDRMVVCHGQSIVKGKDGEELDFNQYPHIEYPKQFVVSVTGMDNIRNSLSYMTRMGIDYSHLNNEMFFDALSVAEELLSPSQRDFKQVAFHIVNRGTAEKPDRAIVAFSNEPDKLDKNRQLPRYYMHNNAMLYNKPAQREMDEGLPMDRLILSQPNYVRVNGRDNLLDTMNVLKQHGVSFTSDVENELVKTFDEGQVMPRAVAARDRIYLGVSHGIAKEVNMNVSEFSIDEYPLLEVSKGVIQKASLYDRDVLNAYLVATFDEDNKLDYYVKVPASGDALHQAQMQMERLLDNPERSKGVDVRIIEVDKDFKDSVEYRMARRNDLQQMLEEKSQDTFKEISRFPMIRQTAAQQEDKSQIINPLNNTTMAKKSKAEEAQVQEPEVKKQENEEQETQQTASEEQQAKKELREGAHVFQAKGKDGNLLPGIYRVMVVKEGVKSEVATISKEDRDQYFADVKGKTGEEAEAVRKALAEKYITPDGKRIEAPKAENAEKQQSKEAEKPFIIRHASEEKAQRITEPKLYKRTDNGLYAIRCKIDGEQQMSRTFDTANKDPKIADFNKKLIDAFFSGYKGLDADKQLQRRVDVAAIKFNDILNAEKQELAKGMSR